MNEERFEQVLTAIEAGVANGIEADLDMNVYASKTQCGTTLCLAGWAAVLSGDPPDWPQGIDIQSTVSGRDIHDVGAEWLGMNCFEQNLFYASAVDANDLRRKAERMKAGRLPWQ